MTINMSEAKAHLGRYVAKASVGEVITICDRNRPLAELRPVRLSVAPRKLKLGALKGKFSVPEDFNAALPEFEAAFYGSRKKKSLLSK
jgi:prevent-host-death family protein